MGKITYPEKVKLIIAMLSSSEELFETAQRRLEQVFGSIDFCSQILPFTFTQYYMPEMGEDLKRRFISFSLRIQSEELAGIKVLTNSIEQEFIVGDRRRINLDSGYITAAKLILATTKDNSHRIYLSNGIYAEITLRFVSGTFRPWEWTYPDYKTPEYIEIFNHIRQLFMEQR
ncbi:DUF4416 domain-containing protein [Candidatus Desantisbacteria bacterium CG_4_10_14_3_um_filter_40_18]|uniref:DUF4416 domain-containing protein n=1 Tax=Candidatus Desantisbacteria bacterium CG_4_10_14_3_um_filter_40_18 TaxID=1974544 RepID=A0A2M7P1N9_9BACT|nr:MAG: DUF4416 domain-containing protein [Candidatus Desantisbacteria bacterium CG_4_10_14_3_um_filter_40_18]